MYGQLGLGQCKTTDPGHMVCQETPQQVSGIDDGNIIALACGLDNTVVATGMEKERQRERHENKVKRRKTVLDYV